MLDCCHRRISLAKNILLSSSDEEHFYKMFSFFICLFLMPFVIIWIFKGYYLLAFLEALQVIFFSNNLHRMRNEQPELAPKSVVLSVIAVQLFLLSYFFGSSAALWTYPLLATYYFMLPLKKANCAALTIIVTMGIILLQTSEAIFAIGFLSSALATLIISNLVININNNLQNKLLQLSISDPLTDCYNRRHMDNTLNQVTKLFHRRSTPASILLIDIDHFKKINDSLGHQVGDDILQQLVKVIHNSQRESDMLFRFGGEEFVLLLPDADQQSAVEIAEKYRKLLSAITVADTEQALTVSIGVCEIRKDMNADDWIKNADQALYQAKNSGRDRVCISQLEAKSKAAKKRPFLKTF